MARKKTEGSSSGVLPPQAAEGEPEAIAPADATAPNNPDLPAGEAETVEVSLTETGPGDKPLDEEAAPGAEPVIGAAGETEDAALAVEETVAAEPSLADAATPTDPWAQPAEPVAAPSDFPWTSARPSTASWDDPAPLADTTEKDPEPASLAAPGDAGAAPHAAEPSHEAHDHVEEHEEEGWSAAAKALAFLLVLLGGAVAGIWAAPRVAPHLPAGMSGVAAWLTPGASEADARVAALEGRIDAELAALNAKVAALPGPDAIQSGAKAAADALRAELATQMDAMRQQISDAAAQAGGGAMGERVGQVESALAGANSQLAALKDQIEAGAAGLGASAQQGLDTYRAELEGMKAEVGRLAGSVSGLGTRFDAASTAAETRASEAEQQAAAAADEAAAARGEAAVREDLAAIRGALASGAPFQEPLDRLAKDAGVSVPPGLSAVAATGVATTSELRDSFGPAAHDAIRASIQASAGTGLVARAQAFLESQVASRSLAPKDGADPDAVLSRVEDNLRQDDLSTALAEADKLPSEAKAALAGWIAAARARADALGALAGLESAAPAAN